MDNSHNVDSVIKCNDKCRSITDIAATDDGIYVVDSDGCQVFLLNKKGEVVKSFGKEGVDNTELMRPSGIAVGGNGRVVVADSLNHRIKV